MLTDKQQKKFNEFYSAARNNDILQPKTTFLLHLAAAMAVGCSPCMEHYLEEAEKEGVSPEEIGAVQAVVMAVSAGRVGAQLGAVEKRLEAGGGCCG
ncbi:MAG: carboxymuconolactone decarboxylase family protein [Desulfuromonadaceae bacterium]